MIKVKTEVEKQPLVAQSGVGGRTEGSVEEGTMYNCDTD